MATLTVTPIRTFTSGETVTPTKLNELSQPTVALTAGTIVAADLASDAVTTAKILDANVTTAKILDANVTTAKIADSAVTTAKVNDAAVTPAKLSQPYTLATSVASTSGTSIDFTGIPSWAKRITVMLDGVSTSGTSNLLLRLGTSGGFVTSGYSSWCLEATNATVPATNTSTAGILLTQDNAAADTTRAVVTVTNLTANTWLATGTGLNGSWGTVYSASVGLGGVLTQVRITTVNGTDTFDAGTINISYEG